VKGCNVCRMYGAGSGQGSGKVNPSYKHGVRSSGYIEMRKPIYDLLRTERDFATLIDERSGEDHLTNRDYYA